MKKIVTALFFIIAINQSAFAGWRHNAFMLVTPNVVTANVHNGFARPMVCSGYTYGRSYYGNTFNTWMNSIIVWPGQTIKSWVYSTYNDRFVRGWANIWCRWY